MTAVTSAPCSRTRVLRGSTIAATDVADSVAWLYLGLRGDLSDQMVSGLLGCFRV